MASLDNWTRNADGNVKVAPLTLYQTALVPHACVLRLGYAETPDRLEKRDFDFLQLVLTGGQCRELALLLLDKADEIDRQPPPVGV
jgi:hypothetical protein